MHVKNYKTYFQNQYKNKYNIVVYVSQPFSEM